MSLSGQLLSFLGVAAIYILFTFAWGWYKGRQEEKEAAEEREASARADGGGD